MPKTEPTQELQIIPAELSPVIQDTKIELSKAESHARAFAPSMQTYVELADKLKGLNKDNPTDADAKIARENRLKMVKVRTSAEEIKDLRKEGIKAEGDLIQALYNVVKNSCIVTETEFTEIEKFAERKEQERQLALIETRKELLAEFCTDTSYLPLGVMTDEQFDRLIENEKLAATARKEAAEKAEATRIEAERLAEEKRLADIEADRLAREEQAKENERLKAEEENRQQAAIKRIADEEAKVNEHIKTLTSNGFELTNNDGYIPKDQHRYSKGNYVVSWGQLTLMSKAEVTEAIENVNKWIAEMEAKEELLAKEREAAAKEAKRLADIADAEKKKRDAELAKEREASAKLAEELRLQKEAKDKAEQEEKARIEAEESERIAREKAALAAPDKEKVRQLHTALKAIIVPEFATKEGKEIGNTMREALDILIKGLVSDSKKLL